MLLESCFCGTAEETKNILKLKVIKTRAKTYETEHKIYGEDHFENKWIFSQNSNQFVDVKTYVEGGTDRRWVLPPGRKLPLRRETG